MSRAVPHPPSCFKWARRDELALSHGSVSLHRKCWEVPQDTPPPGMVGGKQGKTGVAAVAGLSPKWQRATE
eukprot:4494015-Heterocapsa_arctica.AAC.1